MKKYITLFASAAIALSLTACSDQGESKSSSSSNKENKTEQKGNSQESKEQTISYLGKDYNVPAKVNNIVLASLESMEDAAELGVKPAGVLEVNGKVPDYLAKDLGSPELIGDKFAPNNEAVLKTDPDVILASTKHGEDVISGLEKIQTTIPYSHLSENWDENLELMGKISGKESEAEKVISEYNDKAAKAKEELGDSMKDKKVLVLRIRGGNLAIYSPQVYLNSVLYEDLGLPIPEIVEKTKMQEELSLETLAKVDPDYIFLQFEDSENTDSKTALDDTLKDPIFKNIKAAKEDHVFVNTIDPLAQGGTAWSKNKFIDVAVDKLSK